MAKHFCEHTDIIRTDSLSEEYHCMSCDLYFSGNSIANPRSAVRLLFDLNVAQQRIQMLEDKLDQLERFYDDHVLKHHTDSDY